MKLAIYSDTHNEMVSSCEVDEEGKFYLPIFDHYKLPDNDDVDVIILAGDIHVGPNDGMVFARRRWPTAKIIYVAGNHEFYRHHFQDTIAKMREAAKILDIHFFENDAVEIAGVRFLGTSLWTDFELYGAGEPADHAMQLASRFINDFRKIGFGDEMRNMAPEDARELNVQARAFLRAELAKPFAGKTVVITHWLPHPDAIQERFVGDRLTPYFCCDCRDIMSDFPIDLWVFGHSHGSTDFVDTSGCRVLSNQMGYPHESPMATWFNESLVVEL
jgi:predicted phosphodiesterase